MKIALVGSAPSSVNLAPVQDARYADYLGGRAPNSFQLNEYIDQEWQIWGVSPGAWAQLPRADRWFEVHRWEPGVQPWFSPEYVQFLRDFKGPVYTGGPIPEIPNHVPYPIDEVEAEFSAYFLTSSLSLMMAIAIMEIEAARERRAVDLRDWPNAQPPLDPATDDVIGLWGVDMAAMEEYSDQRLGCQYFILEALRRGIAVYTPPESCLLRPKPIYGLSEWSHDYIKATARAREMSARGNAIAQQIATLTQQQIALQGESAGMKYFIETWMSPYGLPAGIPVKLEPGTGLGGGFTLRRPIDAHIGRMEPEPAAPQLVPLYQGGAGEPPISGGLSYEMTEPPIGGVKWEVVQRPHGGVECRQVKRKPSAKRKPAKKAKRPRK